MSLPTLRFDRGGRGVLPVDLPTLISTRMLVQANSGGGKSYAIRGLLEQTHGKVQHIIIDPEGEFATLRESFPYIVAGVDGDVPASPKSAKLLARRLLELEASTVVDIYDLKLAERRRFVRLFLESLMSLPRRLWHPTLVVIDEAHRYCPEGAKSESAEAVITLCTQGRKRGYAAVLATQRLSKLNKDAAAETLNRLIGRTQLDLDVKRAGDDLGLDKPGRAALRELDPGEWYVYGPAIGKVPTKGRTAERKTTHPQPGTIGHVRPPAPAKVKKLLGQLADIEADAAEEAQTIEALSANLTTAERALRKVERELTKERKRTEVDPEEFRRQVEAAVTAEVEAMRSEVGDVVDAQVRAYVRDVEDKLAEIVGAANALTDQAREMHSAAGALAAKADHTPDSPTFELTPRKGAKPGAPRRVTRKRTRSPDPIQPRPATGAESKRADVRRGYDPSTSVGFNGTGELSDSGQRVVRALAEFRAIGLDDVDKRSIAVQAGHSPTSGSYAKTIAELRDRGVVTCPSPGRIALRDGYGDDLDITPPADLDEYHQRWYEVVGPRLANVLRSLIDSGGEHTKHELADLTGHSPTSGSYAKYLGQLRKLGAIHYPTPGSVAPTPLMYPETLK